MSEFTNAVDPTNPEYKRTTVILGDDCCFASRVVGFYITEENLTEVHGYKLGNRLSAYAVSMPKSRDDRQKLCDAIMALTPAVNRA